MYVESMVAHALSILATGANKGPRREQGALEATRGDRSDQGPHGNGKKDQEMDRSPMILEASISFFGNLAYIDIH